MARFSRSFFLDETTGIARDLLGARMVRTFPDGRRLVGRIVETEAYLPDDPASHAYQRITPRSSTMYGPPGRAYVYLIYGMYWCFNVVTEPEGTATAVLVRGLDGIDGCAGPGKLCRRLEIDRSLNGVDLLDTASPLRLMPASAPPPEPIVTTTRIGITRGVELPLRFYLAGSPGVSRK